MGYSSIILNEIYRDNPNGISCGGFMDILWDVPVTARCISQSVPLELKMTEN